ncbi:hypothetical protein [Ferviditalea candida]|uniref:Uncharacterized protein n=1 Tax=Ferviditalea candida TaxID=3108399 RepID=A0ABU5ZMZ5_9BACL|nr:hypothetical protein [Paenibacillaceae bacterium T2]
MKWLVRLILTSIVSIGIAMFLSFLPQLEIDSSKVAEEVFRLSGQYSLSDGNIVDFMQRLPLRLTIRKVDLSHSILSVDLSVSGEAGHADVYHDLYVLAGSGLLETRNVEQVMVRVLDTNAQGSGSGQLLIAMDARKESMRSGLPLPGKFDPDTAEQYLRQHAILTYTQNWKNKYPA